MTDRVYEKTECWCCGVRYDNTHEEWPYCPNCAQPAQETLSISHLLHLQDVHKQRSKFYQQQRDKIVQQQAEVERLQEHIRSLEGDLYHADANCTTISIAYEDCKRALLAIRDSNPPLPSERNKSYFWMSLAKHYQAIARRALEGGDDD